MSKNIFMIIGFILDLLRKENNDTQEESENNNKGATSGENSRYHEYNSKHTMNIKFSSHTGNRCVRSCFKFTNFSYSSAR